MNRNITYFYTIFFCCLLGSLLWTCHSGKGKKSTEETQFNDVKVKVFGEQLERTTMAGEAKFYNEAFDEAYLKEVISDNSIVKSSFDSDFGFSFFRAYLNEGNQCRAIVDNGGQYRFVRQYEENGQHHIVFRKYVDLGNMEIRDYTLELKEDKVKICNGYIYNNSTTLENDLRYTVLYHVLKQTNPQGEIHFLEEARALLEQGKSTEALLLLQREKAAIVNYPYYKDLYIRALYETDSKNFLSRLEEMVRDSLLDTRAQLLHTLLYCANQGLVEPCQAAIEALISYSGDDPIYLLFFAHANFTAKNYQIALDWYRTAEQNMPLIWDVWYGQLACYATLHDKDNFQQTLEKSHETFGMTAEEMADFKVRHFPKMK
jgi:tetratricopeptide (TPR) repeat protein